MKMKTVAILALTALLPSTLVVAQAPPAQKSVPLPAPVTPTSQIVPSTEALAWAQKSLAGWPESVRRLGAQLVTKYGQPSETTARQTTWVGNGPWARTTLYKEGVQHNFAAPHRNVLEQVVLYKVPIDKLAELASLSDSEDLNFLALNIAHDIVTGERTAEQARTYYAQIVRAKMIKEPERDLQKLKFTPAKSSAETADVDEVAPLIKHMSGADTAAE